MSDNLQKKGNQDDIRININQDFEVRDWAAKFNVSKETLIAAVKAVGVYVKDVKKYLGK